MLPIDMRMINSKDSTHQKAKAHLPHLSPTILKPPPSLSLALGSPTHAAPLRMKSLIQAASNVGRAWGKRTSARLWPTPLSIPAPAPAHTTRAFVRASGLELPSLGLRQTLTRSPSRPQGHLGRGFQGPWHQLFAGEGAWLQAPFGSVTLNPSSGEGHGQRKNKAETRGTWPGRLHSLVYPVPSQVSCAC